MGYLEKKNPEGYLDLTAHDAIKKADEDKKKVDTIFDVVNTLGNLTGYRIDGLTLQTPPHPEKDREEAFHRLIEMIFNVCDVTDFHIDNRIVIRDKQTGEIWR